MSMNVLKVYVIILAFLCLVLIAQSVYGLNVREHVHLVKNTDNCFEECYSILHVNIPIDFTITKDNWKFRFEKRFNWMKGLKDYWFEIRKLEDYNVAVPIFDYDSGVNEWVNPDEPYIVGYNMVPKQKVVWKRFNPVGKTIQKNKDYYVKLVGIKEIVWGEPNDIEWVPTILGTDFNEWAWWNTSCEHRKQITITNNDSTYDLDTNSLVCFIFDTTSTNLDDVVDANDLRVTSAVSGSEVEIFRSVNRTNDTNTVVCITIDANVAASGADSTNYKSYYECGVMDYEVEPDHVFEDFNSLLNDGGTFKWVDCANAGVDADGRLDYNAGGAYSCYLQAAGYSGYVMLPWMKDTGSRVTYRMRTAGSNRFYYDIGMDADIWNDYFRIYQAETTGKQDLVFSKGGSVDSTTISAAGAQTTAEHQKTSIKDGSYWMMYKDSTLLDKGTINMGSYWGGASFIKIRIAQYHPTNPHWFDDFELYPGINPIGMLEPTLTLGVEQNKPLVPSVVVLIPTVSLYWGRGAHDYNHLIKFEASDTDSNYLVAQLYYSVDGNGFENLIADINLYWMGANQTVDANCADNDFSDATECWWDANISGWSDNNYFIDINIFDGDSNSIGNSNTDFGIDKNAPVLVSYIPLADTTVYTRTVTFLVEMTDSNVAVSGAFYGIYLNGILDTNAFADANSDGWIEVPFTALVFDADEVYLVTNELLDDLNNPNYFVQATALYIRDLTSTDVVIEEEDIGQALRYAGYQTFVGLAGMVTLLLFIFIGVIVLVIVIRFVLNK